MHSPHFGFRLMECPCCGYVAANIEKGDEVSRGFLATSEFTSVSTNPEIDPTARRFLVKAAEDVYRKDHLPGLVLTNSRNCNRPSASAFSAGVLSRSLTSPLPKGFSGGLAFHRSWSRNVEGCGMYLASCHCSDDFQRFIEAMACTGSVDTRLS